MSRSSLLLIPALAALPLLSCTRSESGGGGLARADIEVGERLLRGYDCGGCHVIPGVSAASGTVGPPLSRWVERKYIAGALLNTPDNLVQFLVSPQRVQPGGGMPDLGLTPEEARHMAAYLYTLGNPREEELGPWHPFSAAWLKGAPRR